MTRMCIYDDDIEFSLLFEKLLYRYAEENDKEIDVEIFQGGENAALQIAQNEYDILFLDVLQKKVQKPEMKWRKAYEINNIRNRKCNGK